MENEFGFQPQGSEELAHKEQERLKEELVEKAMDIHQYEGPVQYTQVPNVPSILTHDLMPSGSRRWGSQGRITKGQGGTFEINLTSKSHRDSFSQWDNLPWSKEGQLAVMFDLEKWEEKGIEVLPVEQDPDSAGGVSTYSGNLLSYDQLGWLCAVGHDHFIVSGQAVPKESIQGLVLSPHSGHLERKRGAINQRKKGDHGADDKILEISHDKAIEILVERMNRLLELQDQTAHLVPIYDYNGDMIWPERISYEKIKEKLDQKQAQS